MGGSLKIYRRGEVRQWAEFSIPRVQFSSGSCDSPNRRKQKKKKTSLPECNLNESVATSGLFLCMNQQAATLGEINNKANNVINVVFFFNISLFFFKHREVPLPSPQASAHRPSALKWAQSQKRPRGFYPRQPPCWLGHLGLAASANGFISGHSATQLMFLPQMARHRYISI